MAKADLIDVQGVVTAVHSGGIYRVQCDPGNEVLAQMSGRMKRFRIQGSPRRPRHGGRITLRHDTRIHHLPHKVETPGYDLPWMTAG